MTQPTAQDIGLPQLKQLMDKNFWFRPEGKVGKFLLLLGGLVLAGGLIVSLPAIGTYLLFVFQTATQILLHLAFIGAACVVATNKWIRALAGSMFRAAVRSAVSIFVNMAPVAVARDFIAFSRKKLIGANEAAKRFKAKMGIQKKGIERFRNTFEEQEALAKSYFRKKMLEEAQGAQVRAARAQKRMRGRQEWYTKMESLARALDAGLKKAKIRVDNIEAELNDQIAEYELAMDARSSIADFKEAIGATGSTRKEMADMAAAHMALEVANVVMEIDDMVNLSEEMFIGVDAEEAVLSERTLKKFQQWEQEMNSSVLAPGEKAAILSDALDESKPYDLEMDTISGEVAGHKKFSANDFFSN